MPWRTVDLRGTRVFARCSPDGKLLEEDGKVEIRYRQNDGKAYRALSRNLVTADGKILPDAHCGEASAAPKPSGEASDKKPAAASKAANKSANKAAHKAAHVPHVLSNEHVVAYTDGACSGNPGPAGLGVVMVHGNQRRELSEYLGVGTNNVAELTAILRALEAMEEPLPIFVHTDSQYAIGVLTKGWKAKANQALILRIQERMAQVKQLRLVYVPGHAGVPLNERADELARAAVTARRSSDWQSSHG